MGYAYQRQEPVLKRMPIWVDRGLKIQAFDVDNLYPLRAWEARNRSYTTKRATQSLAKFIKGGGFADPLLSTLVLNSKGLKGNDMLSFIANDISVFDGYALIVGYDLNYRINSITPVKFMFVRMGLPDEYGEVYDLKVSNNWEQDPRKNIKSQRRITEYPAFNPDPLAVAEEVQHFGGILKYPGQVLYLTPEPWEYPLATFDAVFDYAQVQHETGVFDVSSMQNGFTATTIFRYPGTFETPEEKEEFARKLSRHKGSTGANSTIVVEDPTGEAKQLVENLNMPNVDKQHEQITKTAKDSIRENFSQPMEILGVAPETGMFNRQQMQEAYEFYNTITQEYRDKIADDLEKVFTHWHIPLAIGTYNIISRTYGQVTNGQTNNNTVPPATVPANGGA